MESSKSPINQGDLGIFVRKLVQHGHLSWDSSHMVDWSIWYFLALFLYEGIERSK